MSMEDNLKNSLMSMQLVVGLNGTLSNNKYGITFSEFKLISLQQINF